ncbi:MAG: phosphatidylglycerol lysyltransferase domain-containing protein [bacterium]|nr:phosphatidylglycerol lysyltransferase domain-containing protein [bacterium]
MQNSLRRQDRAMEESAPPPALLQSGNSPISFLTYKGGLERFGSLESGYLLFANIAGSLFVLGDPTAEPARSKSLLQEFCQLHPRAVFVQISAASASTLKQIGWHVSPFGLETSLSLPYKIFGRRGKDIRHLCNRATAAGVRVKEILPNNYRESIEKLLPQSQKGRPSGRHGFSFLTHSEFDFNDRRIKWFAGFIGRELLGLSIFYPIYNQSEIVGYAEILPVRSSHAPKGCRVKILVQSMTCLAGEGARELNLGLSPFATPVDKQARTNGSANGTEKMFRMIFRYGNSFFNFKGLAFHKSRFRGRERTVYYATKSRLPVIELARLYVATTGSILPLSLRQKR